MSQIPLQPIFSVSEFVESINHLLVSMPTVTVRGEISNLTIKGQLIFMAIKDSSSNLDVFATTFQVRNSYQFEVGMEVEIEGKPGLYQRSGKFRLQATSISPAGEGQLNISLAKLEQQLTDEGLFDPTRKRPLPLFPQNIGLLTADQSQALKDYLKVTSQRCGGITIHHLPVVVQGNEAIASIIAGLDYFNQQSNLDLVILTRGGGSADDLAAFNDEALVRAVRASKHPIVCAIGHEGDTSLAEKAADLRASTPSNAAELTIPDKRTVNHQIDSLLNTITNRIELSIIGHQHQLDQSLSRLNSHITSHQHKLSILTQKMLATPITIFSQLDKLHQTSQRLAQQLTWSQQQLLTSNQAKLEQLSTKLSAYDFQSPLKRGYSLTTFNGKILSNPSQVKSGDTITTQLATGQLTSQVKSQNT